MGLMRKLTSAIVASSLVFGLVGSAFADFTPEAAGQAAANMQGLKIVEGREGGDLALNATITRAELVTIIVRAYGHRDTAALLQGVPSFPDVAGTHWASGNVAMAKRIIEANGHTLGLPDGTFNPEGQVTAAEAVAFLLKFLGVEFNASTTSWPDGYIQVAVDAGVITAGDKTYFANQLNAAATRGVVFYLADNAFRSYNIGGGKTVYTTYLDPIAPQLTVDAVEATTLNAKVTVSGSVNADAHKVFVNGKAATITAGKFSAEVELKVGANEIVVIAEDLAGNKTTVSRNITRNMGDAASIEAAAITVAAGASVDLGAVVKDAAGNAIADAVIAGESTLGKVEAGQFVAGTKAGTGTVTLTSGEATITVNVTVTAGALAKVVADKVSVGVGERAILSATDEHGNVITGATFTMDSADANVGSANGVFIASKAGNYTVTATKDGVSKTGTVGVYGAAKKVVVSAPTKVVGNGSTKYEVTARVVDDNGNVVSDANGVSITLAGGTGVTVYNTKADNASPTNTFTATGVKNGTYTFKVAADAALRGQVFNLEATSSTLTKGTASVEVDAQVASGVKVGFGGAKYLIANQVTTQAVTINVIDQEKVNMATGLYSAKVVLTGPATFADGTKEATVAVSNGTGTVNIQSVQGFTGAVTVAATVEGIGTASGDLSAVVAGTVKNIVVKATDDKVSGTAGTALTYNISFTDANGVPTWDGAPSSVSLDFGSTKMDNISVVDATGANIKSTKTVAIGEGDANKNKFTVNTTGAFIGTLTTTIKATGLTNATASSTWNAGAEHTVKLDRTTTINIPAADPKATVSAQLFDSLGNKVAKAGIELTLEVTAGTASNVTINGEAEKFTAKTDANGVATFDIVARPFSGTSYTFAVSGKVNNDGAALVSPNTVDVAVTTSTPASIAVTLHDATTGNTIVSATAGQSVYARVTVKDNYGANLASQAGNLVLDVEKILWNGSELVNSGVTFGTTATTGVYESTAFIVGKAGLQTLKVKNEAGQTVVEGSRSLNVAAAANLGNYTISGFENNSITVKKSTVTGPYTLQLADAYGNAISMGTQKTLTVAAAPGIALRATQAGADLASIQTFGSYSFHLAAGASTGTYTFTLTDGTVSKTFTVVVE